MGFGRAARYRLAHPVSQDVLGGGTSVAAAVRQRVTLPLADRLPKLAALVSLALVLEDAFDVSTLCKCDSFLWVKCPHSAARTRASTAGAD